MFRGPSGPSPAGFPSLPFGIFSPSPHNPSIGYYYLGRSVISVPCEEFPFFLLPEAPYRTGPGFRRDSLAPNFPRPFIPLAGPMKIHDDSPFPLNQLREELLNLHRKDLVEQNEIIDGWSLNTTDKSFLPIVRKLAAYIARSRLDIRKIQGSLASLGLSSLGRSKPHVRRSGLRHSEQGAFPEGGALGP